MQRAGLPSDISQLTTRGLTADERIALASRIVEAFSGTAATGIDESELLDAEARIGMVLPRSLRAAHRQILTSPGMNSQDRFIPAASLRADDGFLIFRVENQGCAYWAVRADDCSDDPHVWISTMGDTWQPDNGPLSSFIVDSALSEAIFTAEHCNNGSIDPDQVPPLRAHYSELDVELFTFWPEPLSHRVFFGGVDTLIAVDADTWLWVACRSEEALARATGIVPTDWLMG